MIILADTLLFNNKKSLLITKCLNYLSFNLFVYSYVKVSIVSLKLTTNN